MEHIRRGDTCPDCITTRNLAESICRKYLEYLFDLPFKKKTFDWLINNEGNKQELDGYNAELNLAFERDGEQHYKYVKYFHKTEEEFRKRQNDDVIKTNLCEKYGITLIRIPYTVKYNDTLDYIKSQCLLYNIKYEDKPNISTEELNVYNQIIEERNNEIDKKLNPSIWVRKSNAITSNVDIKIACKTCHNTRNVLYTNLMKINRKLPDCTYCFHEEKGKELQDIISKRNWMLLEKYTFHKTPVLIECKTCRYQMKCIPRNIMYMETIQKCPICKK